MTTDLFLKKSIQFLAKYSCFIHEIGLLNGKAGISLFLYEYARFYQDDHVLMYAAELVGEVTEIEKYTLPISVREGVCGIGLSLFYLTENNFVTSDFEKVIKYIESNLLSNFDSIKPDYFIGLFHLKRNLLSYKTNKANRKSMDQIINRTYEILKEQKSQSQSNILYINKISLHSLLYFISVCLDHDIANRKIKSIFKLLSGSILLALKSAQLDADSFIILQFHSHINKYIKIESLNSMLAPRQWLVNFELSDFITFYQNKIFYADTIDIRWNNLFHKKISDALSECEPEILEQILENLSLNNLSFNYFMTGLGWAILYEMKETNSL